MVNFRIHPAPDKERKAYFMGGCLIGFFVVVIRSFMMSVIQDFIFSAKFRIHPTLNRNREHTGICKPYFMGLLFDCLL